MKVYKLVFWQSVLLVVLFLFASQVQAALNIGLEFNPDPIQPGELLDAQISISNPTGSPTGQLSLQVLWPEHINIQQLHASF